MREWFSAAELASKALPGLPTTERAIQLRAQRDDWTKNKRRGRGGGWEYAITSLPEEARLALIRSEMNEHGAAGVAIARRAALQDELKERGRHAARQASLAQFPHLDERRKSRAEARAAIVAACDLFIRASGLPLKRGRELFAHEYNEGRGQVLDDVRALIPRVCSTSIENWERQLREEGLARLAGRHGAHRKGSGKIDSEPEVKKLILGMIVDHPHVSAKLVMRGLRARFGGTDTQIPSYRSLQRWIGTWRAEHKQLEAAIRNPDEWRSRFMAAGGDADAAIVRLNQRWEQDGTKADLLLKSDQPRHCIIGGIDVFSRRLKFHVSRSNSAQAVATLNRKCLLDWGVPEQVGTDNGSDYTSKHIVRVFDGLAIEHDIAPPYTPDHKPFIERAFRTFLHDLVELCPGFIGHNVAERKDIEARRSFADRMMKGGAPVEIEMTPEELQNFCDAWTETIYGVEPHSGLGGKSPFQVTAEWTQPIRRIGDERALDVLLAPAPDNEFRTITKKGIRLDKALFEHPALGGREGEQVRVLLDEADIGEIYVFTPEGEFICKAVCPERTGISRRDLAVARKVEQKRKIAAGRAALKEIARAADTKHIVREILMERATAAGKLAPFPQRAVSHETEALAEAARAVRSAEAPIAAPISEAEQRRLAELEREMSAQAEPAPAEVVRLETKAMRFAKALDIENRISSGQAVDAEERRWLEAYVTTSEYRAQKRFREDFGDDAADAFATGA